MSPHKDGRVPCPVQGCPERMQPDMLMCLDCWRQVPRRVQRELQTSIRRYRRYRRAHLGVMARVALGELRRAQDLAIASVPACEFEPDARGLEPEGLLLGGA